jgi:hypothetical protein
MAEVAQAFEVKERESLAAAQRVLDCELHVAVRLFRKSWVELRGEG